MTHNIGTDRQLLADQARPEISKTIDGLINEILDFSTHQSHVRQEVRHEVSHTARRFDRDHWLPSYTPHAIQSNWLHLHSTRI